jgi:hypothetical protein
MTRQRKSILIRLLVLAAFAVALFIVESPLLYHLRIRDRDTLSFAKAGVSLVFETSGMARVRIDDREEVIPKAELSASPFYQEALRRVTSQSRLGQPYFELCWPRLIRFWLPGAVLLYFILFRWWPPRTDYVAGPRAL